MSEVKKFSPIDELAARLIAQNDEDLFHFFCYVACTFRQGYLYVEAKEASFEPFLEELSDPNMQESVKRGFSKLSACNSPYFVCRGARVYLERAYTLTNKLQRLQ